MDLVVRNKADLSREVEGLPALKEALSESNIPFLVDIIDWSRIPGSFKREIEKSYVVLK